MGLAGRVLHPRHRLGHGEDAAVSIRLLESAGLCWALSVAASAYGVARLATGHHTGHDIAILVIGLGAGALLTVAAVRRHRRRTAPLLDAPASEPPDAPVTR